jgi:outer membrane receptor protein involved in Fe transport
MRVNWAYYNSEYDDQQVSTFVGLGFVVTNAASTEISGFELDTAFQVTDKLRLNLSVGTVDGEYADFKGAACTELQAADLAFANFVTPGGLTPSSPNLTSADGLCSQLFDAAGNQTAIAQDLSGRELGTAKWSGSFGAQFVQPIGAMAWFTELDVQFVDDYLMTGDLDPIDSQEAVERINLRTGLQGENWMVMLYGRNITNENLATGGADVPLARGSHMRYLARGEVFGIQVAWEF